MIDSTTTFTVVRNHQVYVTEKVPCLECSVCGHISFSQDTAKRLEEYSSGKVIPFNTSYRAFVFKWNDPVIKVEKTVLTEGIFFPKPNIEGTLVFSPPMPVALPAQFYVSETG